jgi:hypothetical protein
LEAAAAWAQTAATFAWFNHCGIFASDSLEKLLQEIARRTESGARESDRRGRRPKGALPTKVLHVATQVYPTGGHTQALRCWILQDSGREHRLVITRQGPTPIPDKLSDISVLGQLVNGLTRLDRRPGGLLVRARRLRRAAEWADLVILHTHNNDVVPSLALHAMADAPPTILVDSNDHSFWVGRSSASLVMHMRDSGRDLGILRRGLRPQDSYVLERPLRFDARVKSRDEAKQALGLHPDQVVITTAADPTKYQPVSQTSFLDLVLPVIQARRSAVLVAAGPKDEGAWRDAAGVTGGRVRPLGLLRNPTIVHEASDIYVDSFPFSSLTSLLESGSLGNPTLTYRGHPPGCEVLGADTRGLDHLISAPDSPEEFRQVLTKLVDDPDLRTTVGEETAKQILSSHTGEGWLTAVQAMYAVACSRRARIVPGPPGPASDLDPLVALVMERTGLATGEEGALLANVGLLPLPVRGLVMKQYKTGIGRDAARCVLSEWQHSIASESWHRLSNLFR